MAFRPTPPSPSTATVDRCGIDHRADAGDDGTAEEGSVFQRDVFLDWDNGPFGEDHVLGVAGNAGRMIDDLAI